MSGTWQKSKNNFFMEYMVDGTCKITLFKQPDGNYRIAYYWFDYTGHHEGETVLTSEIDNVYDYAIWKLDNLINGTKYDA